MKYTALYMPRGENGPDEKVFDSEGEAWIHIEKNHLCPLCQEHMRSEGVLHEDGRIERTRHPWETSCGAEWDVFPEDRSIMDLLDSLMDEGDPSEDDGGWMDGLTLPCLDVRMEGSDIMIVDVTDGSMRVLAKKTLRPDEEKMARKRFLDAVDAFYDMLR